MDGIVRQAGVAITAGDFARQHGAAGAVDVDDGRLDLNLLALFEGRLGLFDQLVVECLLEAMVLAFGMATRHLGRDVRLVEDLGEVQALRLPVFDTGTHVEQIGTADQIVELADAELSHDFACFFGNEEEVIHDVFRLAGEALTEHRILGGDADRAGVQVALAHHDAAFDDQRRGGETELIGTEQRADNDVAAGLHLTVDLDADTRTQAVQHQGLLGFGQTEFPRRTGVLDGGLRRSARTAVEAGDHDVIGLGLGDTGCHRTDTDFGHQLDRDRSLGVGVLQVMDQLRQILDGVDVVVRRRRDQANARHRVTQEADVLGHLVTRQLAAFTRLGALRHLDLDLVGIDQILGGHAKAAGSDLLDGGTQRVAFLEGVVAFDARGTDHFRQLLTSLQRLETLGILAAFTGIRLAADTVHGDGQRGVRFGRDRAERHGAGGKALDDFLGRLDFVERDRTALRLEFEQAAQGQVTLGLIVDQLGVFLVGLVLARAGRMLQLGDGVRGPHVFFATGAISVFAASIEHGGQHRVGREGFGMQTDGFLGHLEDTDTLDVRRRTGEILLDEVLLQANGFEDLGAGVGHVGRDAHLGHDLAQALADGLDEVLGELLGLLGITLGQGFDGFQREVRMHRFGTVTAKQREMMYFASGTGLDDQTGAGAQALLDQMLVNGGGSQQRRDGNLLGADLTVGDDQDVGARAYGIFGIGSQRGQTGFDAVLAPGDRIADIQFEGAELVRRVLLDVAQFFHVGEGQDRLRHFEADRRVDVVGVQQVRLRTDEGHQRHDQLFADRVDWRVGHLGEQLLEVGVQGLILGRQHRQGGIGTHRTGRFFAVLDHRLENDLDVFLGVAEGLLAIEQRSGRGGALFVGGRHFVELDADLFDPLAVRLGVGQGILQFLVVDDAALFHVDQEHLARLQTPLLDNLLVRDRQHAGFGGHDHEVVVGNQVAGRTQAVTVQRGADLAAVGEGHGGGAVPRLHHGGMVFVEGTAVLVHRRVLFPGFRDHQHDGLGQRVATAHHEQFEGVVEGC